MEHVREANNIGECTYSRSEFEELFYSSGDAIALVKRLTKNYECRLFVASLKHPEDSKFCETLRNDLSKLDLPVSWIVENCKNAED